MARLSSGSGASSSGSAGGGGGGGGSDAPSCVLNVDDRDSIVAVNPDGLTCQARSETAWGGIRGGVGAQSGEQLPRWADGLDLRDDWRPAAPCDRLCSACCLR